MTAKNELMVERAISLLLAKANFNTDVAMEVADLFPAWEANRKYTTGEILKNGTHPNGDAQLYVVKSEHYSHSEKPPTIDYSTNRGTNNLLYLPIGVTDDGVQVWRKPLSDDYGYGKGDVAVWMGTLFQSDVDDNTSAPDEGNWTPYN